METTLRKNKGLATGLGVLQVLTGLGAVAGGLGLALDPSGSSVGMPLDMLKSTPFSTFFMPGIVLLLVIGLGNLVGATASFTRYRYAGDIAIALGFFLIAWILLQVYWFAGFHWLHAMYLVIGLLELTLGWLLRKELIRKVEQLP
jgi:hypothetical protein